MKGGRKRVLEYIEENFGEDCSGNKKSYDDDDEK